MINIFLCLNRHFCGKTFEIDELIWSVTELQNLWQYIGDLSLDLRVEIYRGFVICKIIKYVLLFELCNMWHSFNHLYFKLPVPQAVVFCPILNIHIEIDRLFTS